jgi:hypothetical protein
MLEAMEMGAIYRFKPQLLVATNGFGDSGVAVHEITVPVVKDAINCVPRGCGIRLVSKNFASGSQGILSKKPASPVISLFDFGSNLPMFLSPWKL